jgi:hypothetical protein
MRTLTAWYSGWISGFMVGLPAPQSAPIYAWFDRKLRLYTAPEYRRQGATDRRSRQALPAGALDGHARRDCLMSLAGALFALRFV